MVKVTSLTCLLNREATTGVKSCENSSKNNNNMEKLKITTYIKYKTITRSTAISLLFMGILTNKQYQKLIKTGKTP